MDKQPKPFKCANPNCSTTNDRTILISGIPKNWYGIYIPKAGKSFYVCSKKCLKVVDNGN